VTPTPGPDRAPAAVADLLAGAERLAAGDAERLALTALVVLLVVVVRIAVGRWRARRSELGSARRLAVSVGIAAVTAAGVFVLIGIWGLGGALLGSVRDAALGDQLSNVVLAVIVLGLAYAAADFLAGLLHELIDDQPAVDRHQEEVLRRITQLSIYTAAGLVVLGLFTDNVGSLLIGAGFLGIVVGMAARQTLGAALAGLVLMFSRPFEIGDWIETGEHEGTVTEITIVSTRLRTFDGEYVTIPNDEVRSRPVIDRSHEDRLRDEIEVGIDYDADPERAGDAAVAAVEGIDGVLEAPPPRAVLKRFDDSAVTLGVRYWIGSPSARRRWTTRTDAATAIKAAFEREGIKIPYPQRELSGRADEGGLRLAGDPADERTVATADGGPATGDGSGDAGGG